MTAHFVACRHDAASEAGGEASKSGSGSRGVEIFFNVSSFDGSTDPKIGICHWERLPNMHQSCASDSCRCATVVQYNPAAHEAQRRDILPQRAALMNNARVAAPAAQNMHLPV